MATPRASGLWDHTVMTYSRLNGDDDIDDPEGIDFDSRTPLDKTIDRIGMGTYQWTLLSLCGFGWMADNMWIQAMAIILPRVQRHFSLPDNRIGILSSAMFAGMMIGAIGWGTCSDLMGRSTAFNATLFFTSLFGIAASFATTFPMLCVALFFLGSAVGGSMPTDGTLLLEHMPRGKEYLVTALSVFFSFGAVLAALVAIILIPKNSCQPLPAPCDLRDNLGWKYELVALGIITLTMFIARIVFFRLHESPRYLVHAGRPQDALESLQMISRFNGSELELDLEDVIDRICVPPALDSSYPPHPSIRTENSSTPLFDADGEVSDSPTDLASPPAPTNASMPLSPSPPEGTENAPPVKDYAAMGESDAPLAAHAPIQTSERYAFSYQMTPESRRSTFPGVALPPRSRSRPSAEEEEGLIDGTPVPLARPRPPRVQRPRADTRSSVRSSLYEVADRAWFALPRRIRRPMRAWLGRFSMVVAPEWRRTTLLVWGTWWGMSLAYTMFNVYLPKLLETRQRDVSTSGLGQTPSQAHASAQAMDSLERSLWDVVIFTIGGCPGAVLGAWLIEWPRLGRRLALAGSTFLTALLCVVFLLVSSPIAVTASTVGISLSATTMWAVLYGWTPEIFATRVRGTACGAASALSRIGGMIAPMAGGALLMVDTSFPVYVSIVVFVLSGFCVLLLKESPSAGASKSGRSAIIH
ncbi:MFS general substrate transporter [Lactarius akahatsu]|uniref:MFS general substrate transporter n=1 Tax=Lactarius akahatsu TaxID=416441 RepID=A0AAD4LA43_9AGAM|nr:MFS general substrate transporter [Lactarius akahatsu]